jgi:hypothetical protein
MVSHRCNRRRGGTALETASETVPSLRDGQISEFGRRASDAIRRPRVPKCNLRNQPCYHSPFLAALPCKTIKCSLLLKIGRIPYNVLKPWGNLAGNGSLSLQFLKISLQIANCRENWPAETVSLLTASSARQSSLCGPFALGHAYWLVDHLGPKLLVRLPSLAPAGARRFRSRAPRRLEPF